MKQIFFFAVLLSLVFVACSEDETTESRPATELIVGTWNIDLIIYSECENGDPATALGFGDANCMTTDSTTTCVNGTLNFSQDGTATQQITFNSTALDGTQSSLTEDETGSYELTDDGLILCFDAGCNEGNYSISATSMTWSASGVDGCDVGISASK